MGQRHVIERVSTALADDDLVEALFLGGGPARGTADAVPVETIAPHRGERVNAVAGTGMLRGGSITLLIGQAAAADLRASGAGPRVHPRARAVATDLTLFWPTAVEAAIRPRCADAFDLGERNRW